MRATWQLSINACVGRKGRTGYLIAAVALSTTLVAAVSCALASLNAGIESRIAEAMGNADTRVRHIGNDRFAADVLELIEAQTGAAEIAPRLRAPVRLAESSDPEGTLPLRDVSVQAVEPEDQSTFGSPPLLIGREVASDDEIVLDETTVETLGLGLGDLVGFEQRSLGGDILSIVELELVGVTPKLTLEVFDERQGVTTLRTLRSLTSRVRSLSEVLVILEDGVEAEGWARALEPKLPESLIAEPTSLVTSRLDQMTAANEFTFVLSSTLAFLSAVFIVLTGMTGQSAERQRELAILRCLGATRAQLATTQLAVGGLIGAGGAVLGVPLGVAIAWLLTVVMPDRLPAGLHIWPAGLALAVAGSLGAGLIGAVWSAWSASRTSPIPAMRSRSRATTTRQVAIAGACGLVGLGVQIAVVSLAPSPNALFVMYAFVGLPMMFVGYFLVGVPVAMAVARVIGPVLGRVLGLPGALLRDSFAASPFRNGFTAGALMVGLAAMTSMWTNGNSLLRDWLDAIRFPDAFINGVATTITPEAAQRVADLDIVESTAAISLFKVDTEAFGIGGFFQRPKTTFIAFDPDEFFPMARMHWAAGDEETATERLREGGAVLVAREFLVEREGFEIGSMFPIEHKGRQLEFEIVGAVSSPGLDIVRKFFDVGEEYADYSIHAVFGTREDLKTYFGDEQIDLLQIELGPPLEALSDQEAVAQIREAVNTPGAFVGSGREIKANITGIGTRSLRVGSFVAAAAMVIGALGVGNIVLASIDARRFEFGVLRAIGGGRWMTARLIAGEVVLVCATAAILGVAMGVQGAWAGGRLYAMVAGLDLALVVPWRPVAIGVVAMTAITLTVASPMILQVARRKPRELLAAR